MHTEARAYVARVAPLCAGPVLEVGSRDINGGIRDLFGPDYYGIDLVDGPGVDEVADISTWNDPREWNTIVCCEVLEHCPIAAALLDACLFRLAPEGRLVLTAACAPRGPHSAADGGPIRLGEYYGNVDPDWLVEYLRPDLKDVTVEIHERGDVYLTGVMP